MPSLVVLAQEVLARAQALEAALGPTATDIGSLKDDPLDALQAGSAVERTQRALVDASYACFRMARGARKNGLDLGFQWTDEIVMRLVLDWDLPSKVPLDDSISYADLAAKTTLTEDELRRAIRAAIPLGVFRTSGPDSVAHSALSRLLATDRGFMGTISMQLIDVSPAGRELPSVWARGDSTAGPERSPFAAAHGGSLFKLMKSNKELAGRFRAAMQYLSTSGAAGHVVNAWNWNAVDLPGTKIVDLGGGHGDMVSVLARHTKNASFVVEDLAEVVNTAPSLKEDIAERVSFRAQSFLEPRVSQDEVRVFLISRCLHNWNDEACVGIFKHLVPAMSTGRDSHLLVWDAVLDDEPALDVSRRLEMKQDLVMAVMLNARERSAREFRTLLARADPRFIIKSIYRPDGADPSLIDILWDADAKASGC